ncbi:hypothetical protein [Clostridium pasteurianum]|uniref:Uncharacterized protein n=1 Tax=Clostridium pasteurianum BC1 TaxID=86416 RepID=R4KDJ8_CLOPA|nr:hypothetical protein [Clostridium pasteurianum]AGK97695.1 hypothetical protein Clopa_2857 [Clostridium pasteurianum BC1]
MDYIVENKEDNNVNLTIHIFNIENGYKISEILNKLQSIGYLREIGGTANSNNTISIDFVVKEEIRQ